MFPVDPHLLGAFALASIALLVIPGPTVIMVVSQALGHGPRVVTATVFGVGLGDLAAAVLSLVGVGAVLAASATAFTVLKWLGAAYLVWLGIKMWRSAASTILIEDLSKVPTQSTRAFSDAFLVTLLNPKSIVFFAAFVPQFIYADRAYAPQAAVLIATFVVLGMINAAVYALLAGRARGWFARSTVRHTATRTAASCLVLAGLASLWARRPA